MVEVDGGEVVFEDLVVRGTGEGEVTEVVHVGLRPVGLAGVVVSEATEEGEEASFGASEIVNRVGASPAEVANGFISGIGNVDGDEVIGAE